jgi:hypothetical protein
MSVKFLQTVLKLFSPILVLAIAGCTSSLSPIAKDYEVEHRLNRNYRLGDLMSVNVGEPMVVVQDFWLRTEHSNFVINDRHVEVKLSGYYGSLGSPNYVHERGLRFPVRGEKVIDGVNYSVAGLPVGFLIKSDGTINKTQIYWQPAQNGAVASATISDPSVSFEREKLQTVVSTKRYENYEIIYTGVNASGLNLTYREFSAEGLARVAFFQNLSYGVGVKNISFKKFKIVVETATSEKIVFRVIEDDSAENAGSAKGE